jgi:hypothetical protein
MIDPSGFMLDIACAKSVYSSSDVEGEPSTQRYAQPVCGAP